MSITIGENIGCSVDKCGNVYFRADGVMYDLNISHEDTLYCEPYVINDPETRDVDIDVHKGELVVFSETHTLRDLVIKSKKPENDDDDGSDNELTEDAIAKYYPENLQFNEYNADDDPDTPYFSINIPIGCLTDIIADTDEHVLALYDTLIYDGNARLSDNSTLIAKTALINDLPIYRLCVFTSGHLKFRPIGSQEQIYEITNTDGNLILKRATF